jgi:enamine deaminase RidA (YjgF/YER057c/UK114 family)
LEAIATTSEDREIIRIADLPLAIGAGCHGVRVGDWFFLSGVAAADANGRIAAPTTIQSQTTEALTRIEKILAQQKLALGNLCRTFMFMPGTKHRPGYGEARKKIYQGVFAQDTFPPTRESTFARWVKTFCCAPWRSPIEANKKLSPAQKFA